VERMAWGYFWDDVVGTIILFVKLFFSDWFSMISVNYINEI